MLPRDFWVFFPYRWEINPKLVKHIFLSSPVTQHFPRRHSDYAAPMHSFWGRKLPVVLGAKYTITSLTPVAQLTLELVAKGLSGLPCFHEQDSSAESPQKVQNLCCTANASLNLTVVRNLSARTNSNLPNTKFLVLTLWEAVTRWQPKVQKALWHVSERMNSRGIRGESWDVE